MREDYLGKRGDSDVGGRAVGYLKKVVEGNVLNLKKVTVDCEGSGMVGELCMPNIWRIWIRWVSKVAVCLSAVAL